MKKPYPVREICVDYATRRVSITMADEKKLARLNIASGRKFLQSQKMADGSR